MEKLKYSISSRTAILLGRESVSKPESAIIELIKNCYDADARTCCLYLDLNDDSIYIIDDGTGMNLDIIKNNWLTIGTENKRKDYISEKKRIKSGEKGIGRLSLDRLGENYQLHTKFENEKLLTLGTDWNEFELPDRNLNDIYVNVIEENLELVDKLPNYILKEIKKYSKDKKKFNTGTIIKINKLRDNWSKVDLDNLEYLIGFLLPPREQGEFNLIYGNSSMEETKIIINEFSDSYDYRIEANFDGEDFNIIMHRNEFDINLIPNKLFEMNEFKESPYRKEDFENGVIVKNYSIIELMNNNSDELIERIKKIGKFSFYYNFMKLTLQSENKGIYFYKPISPNRTKWLTKYSGIKIYRDNFMIRPYGDPNSDSFDWLGLDARRTKNPAAISHPSMSWKVRNVQGQGTVFISRVDNKEIMDIMNREGLVSNDYFQCLRDVLCKIISIFEKDRAYIGKNLKKYWDNENEKEKIKQVASDIANSKYSETDDFIRETEVESKKTKDEQDFEIVVKAVKYMEEEKEDLVSELRLLRSLATSGLITSSIVHDLKTFNANLVKRVDNLEVAIKNNRRDWIDKSIETMRDGDEFLKSWITIVTNQIIRDKRNRKKQDIINVIEMIVKSFEIILERKKIKINITGKDIVEYKKMFVIDFESIIYNLIINSIESFEQSKTRIRVININIFMDEYINIEYSDNGNGLGNKFPDPYEIFNFGVTSKRDYEGNDVGSGLGMYIVSSTINDYNGSYHLIEYKDSFKLHIIIPRDGGKK